ncbi:MAG: ATP-binding cassette domain-containing protein [Syntrophomonadaceae bacterium]|nr:ATP-binding cassette domain-containing protein [Syntrophomonadaceae bacterium]
MLECKITKKLGYFVLDVDIQAIDGVTALMGASGSGKSTVLRCIAGVSKPDAGRIVLGGATLFDSEKSVNLPPQKRKVGFLFQDYALFPNMTVLQNIMCGANGAKKEKRKGIAEDLAESFHITVHLSKYPHQLSGGEKQRVALARILAGMPDILMLDEPFSALDSHLRWELENELAAVFARFGKPVLYVSHNRDEVYRLCDNIVILNGGQAEVSGEKWGLFKNPETVEAARLTGCKNIVPCTVNADKIIVPEWGVALDANGETAEFIGIRANYIMSACVVDKSEVAAAFEFEIVHEIESTFTNILYVRKKDTVLPPIRWEMPKKDRAALRALPQKLALMRENLLLLRR